MKKKFTLLIFAILASLGAMASPPQQDEGNVAKWNNTEYATLQEALDAAEAANPKNIVIDLLTDAELDVSARNTPRSIGTTDTESITINGGNNKLTINLLDSDWSDVSTANDSKTKLILNNLNLASGKYNSGHWKRNGIFFSCAVQMNNVNASCGIGFKSDATLNNVTINTTGSNYAVWIQSNGETVNIEGLTVNGGRGIKIADEDAGTETVSLNVNYSKFTTTAKAAILVSSKYGAEITIGSGNDISGVVADTENFVWCDEDWASYFNTINVTGGTKILEGSIAKIGDKFYSSIADAVAAASAGDVIEIFKAGTYTLPTISKNVTLEGTVDGVEVSHTSAGSVASIPNGCTFKNITFNFGNVDYHGFQHAGTINMEGCTLNGKFFSYGDMNFTNCQFNQTNADYHMWAYSGNLVYTGCTFTNNATGKFLNVYNEDGSTKYTVTANNCKFVNNSSSNKAAFNVKATCGDKSLQYDVYVNNCTTEGAFPEVSKSDALYVLNSVVQVDDRKAAVEDRITVTENGVLIYPSFVAQYNGTKYSTLQAALDAAEADDEPNIIIDLLDDATLDINAWSGTGNSQAIGTTNTQSITINGNSHKLTFMTKNTDWNNIATMNDSQTKLVLNNMTIDQGGVNTKGTWNSYDINFNCAVELNNVTAKRALAFKNSATLKDVTVNQAGGSSDVYGIWISPRVENQTINIDGLKLTASAENGKTGRGIKVDDQYVTNNGGTVYKVTLNIANSTFSTEAKAAILLKAAEGVDVIDGGGNIIENVAADNVNLVWVDESRAAEYYKYSLTSTSGATMVPEKKESDYVVRLSNPDGKIMGYYKGTDAIANAVAAATADGYTATIFQTGEYTMPNLPHNITIEAAEGVEGVVFNHTGTGNIASIPNGATFKNLTFNFGNVDYHGFQHAGTINMEGCTLNGKFFSYGDMNFTNCEFNHSGDYHMWTYAGNITYTGCTFTNETKGKFLNVYNDQGIDPAYTVKVTDCKFINKGESSKAALNVKATYTDQNKVQHEIAYDVTITNCTTEGAFPAETITQPLVVLNNLAQVDDRTATGVDYITVTHDGVLIYPLAPVAKIGEVGYPTLQLALDAAHEMTGDVTVQLVADITEYAIARQKADLNLTIEGKEGEANHTITGQIIIDGDGRSTGTETLTIQNIAFTGNQTNFYTGSDAFILIPSTKTSGTPYYTGKYNYAHNVTISDCSFTSTSETLNVVGVKSTSGATNYNLTIQNATGRNLHSLAQLTATEGSTINNCDVEADGFVNIDGGGRTHIISNCKFVSLTEDGYAVREKGNSTAEITLTDNDFTSFKIVQFGKKDDPKGTVTIESGKYVGDIVSQDTDKSTGKIVISGGHFSAPLGDSKYAAFIAEGLSGMNGIYRSETPEAPNGVGEAVAELTTGSRTTKYASLEAAFADAIDGSTITLLKDCAGNGIVVPKGKFPVKGLEVDFGGYTYTVDGSTVGSAGTETNGFQLLMDNKITFMNGTIYSEKAKILVQNYSDLTLTDEMKLDLNNPNYTSAYTLSNNNGNIYINESTINANPAGGFAFDVCRFSSYPSVTVTVAGGSDINGDVEVSASGNDAKEGFTLMLEDGEINGDLVLDASAKAAMNATPDIALVLKRDDFNQPAPEGYMWIPTDAPGVSKLVPENYVAQIGDVKYPTLAAAVAAVPADGTETTITMIDNEMINVVGYAVTIPATKNIVLDLNGYQIVGTVDQEGTSALIRNLGTLTIKDSSDTNADGTGTGKLMSGASSTWTWDGTDDYSGSYATNLIRNEKDLIVESGYLYNMSKGSAVYAIDNYSAGNITIKGGKVDAAKASAIRMFYVNGGSITVKGGDIGHYVSDDDCSYMGIQVMSGDNVNVSITDGTIHGLYALYAGNSGGMIDISGGTFDGYVGIGAVVPNISISGGAYNSWVGTWGDQTKFVSGGIFTEDETVIDEVMIADGYIFTFNTDEATKDEYPYMVKPGAYVAQNVETGKKYDDLSFAINAVEANQTIKLLADVAMTENLIADKSFTLKTGEFTFDPAGHTITIAQTGVTVNVEIAASIIDNFDSSVDGFKVEETVIANGYAYSLVPVEDLDLATIEEGYYNIKNVGNSKYVNVKGRKTATVDALEATSAGTVIKVKATEGKVEILRSQAVDIPSYAQRAMRYVPEVVTLVVDKLGVDGSGKILGETGVDAILEKFYDEFDPNLYVENVDGGYRIFGRTPSMQPVLDFYKENKANVDAKLPELEQAVNDAIVLVVDKLGMGTSLKDSFKLHTIWERMGATNLTEPVDDASKLLFLQEVLSSKNHVWNFAYQTATFYADEVEGKLDQIEGISEDMDVSKYIELAKKIRPDFKYYIVQNEDKMDIISEGNIDIINNADRAVWQIEAAETMTVNVPEENSRIVGATFDENGKRTGFEKGYYTTLYTDFAYQLPEGAVALKVTEIKDAMLGDEPLTYESGDATLTLGLLVTEEIGQEVPAQTPVLIMSKSAGNINITIGDSFGASADVSKNILRGADYLISEYEINTPMLESLYSIASEKVSGLDKYEHLIRKNSGTVNNKYFFSLTMQEIQDAYKAKTGNEMQTSPILTLSKQTGKKLAFNESWENIQPNSVILVSEQTKPALFTLTGDVTRDGKINVADVTAQVQIIHERDKADNNYDYEAADADEPWEIYSVPDITKMIQIIHKRVKHPDLP